MIISKCNFWPDLKQVVYFEAAGTVVKIAQSLKFTHCRKEYVLEEVGDKFNRLARITTSKATKSLLSIRHSWRRTRERETRKQHHTVVSHTYFSMCQTTVHLSSWCYYCFFMLCFFLSAFFVFFRPSINCWHFINLSRNVEGTKSTIFLTESKKISTKFEKIGFARI